MQDILKFINSIEAHNPKAIENACKAHIKIAEKAHYIIQRTPFDKWMKRPENTGMLPLLDTLKRTKEIPLYVYEMPDIPIGKGYERTPCFLSLNGDPRRQTYTAFSTYKANQGIYTEGQRYSVGCPCETLEKAEQTILSHILTLAGIDANKEMKYCAIKTESYKNSEALFDAFAKLIKAHLKRRPIKSIYDPESNVQAILYASSDAFTHFNNLEQIQIRDILSTFYKQKSERLAKCTDSSERLAKVLYRVATNSTRKKNNNRDEGYGR